MRQFLRGVGYFFGGIAIYLAILIAAGLVFWAMAELHLI